MNWKTLLAALPLLTIAVTAQAQYKPFFVQDFEAADWPVKLEHGHSSSPYTTQIITLGPRDPAGILQNNAGAAIGKRALRFQPHQDDPHLSVINNAILSRERLGTDGMALYQVDFYLNEESTSHPRIALLAQASDPVAAEGKKNYRFYRFGLDEKNRVFFSFTNETPTPVIFRQDPISNFNLKRPGWHRFQMRFEGQEEIHLSIDGQPTSYSPIKEGTLNYLAAGAMVTRVAGDDSTIYADNLSVHWAEGRSTPMMPSPWSGSAAPEGQRLNWNTATLNWLTSPSAAWKDSQQNKRMMFVVFHDDRAVENESLLALLSTPEAGAILSRCTLLRINISEPSGQQIADSYNVISGPTLVVCDMNGKAVSQTTYASSENIGWDKLYERLRNSRVVPAQ